MILKFARRGLSSFAPVCATRGIHLFSDKGDKKPNGFDKFSRKRERSLSQKNNESEHNLEEAIHNENKEKKEHNAENTSNNFSNNQPKQGHGRRVGSRKTQNEESDPNNGYNNPFSKFERKPKSKINPKSDPLSDGQRGKTDPVQKQDKLKEESSSSMSTQDQSEPVSKNEEGSGKTQSSNQSFKKQSKILNDFAEQLSQEPQKELKGFEKFANRKRKIISNENKENTEPSQSTTHMKQEEGIWQAEPVEKSEEEKAREAEEKARKAAEKDIKDKEDYFLRKVAEFKKMKGENIGQSNYFSFFNKVSENMQKIKTKIGEKLGIDFNKEIEPPNYIKGNRFLLMAFRLVFSKWMLMLLAFYLLLETYDYFANIIDQINSEQLLYMVRNREALIVTFVDEEFSTDAENAYGKKNASFAVVELRNGQRYRCVTNSQFQKIVKLLAETLNAQPGAPFISVTNEKQLKKSKVSTVRSYLSFILMLLFIEAIFSASKGAGKKGQGMGKQGFSMMNQSKSKRFKQDINVKFKDVVGMQKSKQEIVEFIDFLVNPEKYHKLGAKIPRGALLTGPPGTGKTMIAKACAGESNVPFFTVSGSEFMEMYVGVGAQRVRDLFKEAKQAAPSIIFIDEIDAVGKKRTSGFGGGNDERDNTLNQLLVEMDGFEGNSNVIVFAATNQKEVLDPALTRPGRFDRLIEVDLPDLEGRKQIFMVHLKPIVIDSESSIEQYARRMATLTPGFSGADIKNLCNEAAIMAARNENKFVTMNDFELATERVIGGVEKKSHLITPETKRIVAYHECGHGVVSWFLEGSNPLLKLTIIPRAKGSMGFAQYLPHQTQISTKKQLMDQICVILSGRMSEQVFFGKVSTGAYDDLQKAYHIAKQITTQFGMSKKLGWLTYDETEYAKDYSHKTEQMIDREITQIIAECTERARTMVKDKRELIQKLAEKLLEAETIDLTTITGILGERPFQQDKQYEEYLKEHKKMGHENPVSISFRQSKWSKYMA